MKNLYKFGMLAVAALAFAGCAKEVDNSVEPKTGTHTITFTVQKDIDTKTAVREGDGVASYVWNEDDAKYFVIFENDKKATEVVMTNLSSDQKIATFKATFNDSNASSFVYYAVYGSNVSNAKNPLIPYEQSPALGSFDPAADALVCAEAITLEDGAKADENTEFQFKLRRVVSVNKMTLKGLVAGEKISKVELESSDSYFASRYRYDDKDYYVGNEGSKKLIFDYSKVNATVGEEGTFPVYFTCAPVDDASFSVKVTTDQHLYVRDDFASTLTLAVGTFRRFGINLDGYGTTPQTAVEYKLVEDNAKIVDGAEYLIVAKGLNKAAGAFVSASNPYYSAESVTVSNKVITITSEAVQVFTLEAGTIEGQFNIKDSEGKYLKWSSGNSVNQSTTGYLWTVTKDGITSVNTTDRKLKYNSSSPRFACYTTAQTDIELYANEATFVQKLSTPVIACEVQNNNAISVSWAAIEGAGSYKVTCTGKDDVTTTGTEATISNLEAGFYTVTVTAIASSSSYRDSDPASKEVKVGTPDLAKPVIKTFKETATGFNAEINAAVPNAASYDWDLFVDNVNDDNWIGTGNTTSLSFSGSFEDMDITEYEVGKTYLLVVTAKAEGFNSTASEAASFVAVGPTYAFTTVAGLNELAAANTGEVTGKLTNAIVSFVPGANDAIIKDATGSILYHKNNHELKQGQTFSGVTTVTTTLYNGVCEITAIDADFVGEETSVEPETVALATIAGDYQTWQGAYVKVENLEVDSVNGKNVYVKNGNGTYLVYSNAGNASCASGDIITVIGTVTKFNNNPQIKVWKTSDITVTQQHQIESHTITFTQPSEGGSFTVKVGETLIANGAELEEGTVVSLNATAAEGYYFNGWTVTGATVSGNTSTETFTVGTSDVDIRAAFKSNSNPSVTVNLDSSLGLSNGTAFTSTTVTPITVSGDKNTNSNGPKYYSSGDAVRFYGGNTMTISGATILEVVVTYGNKSNAIGSASVGTLGSYNSSSKTQTWTGNSDSITFTFSGSTGNDQVKSVTITYRGN